MAELSDRAFIDFCAEAERAKLIPDAEARAKLSKILFADYPAFAYDREHWAEAFKAVATHAQADRGVRWITAPCFRAPPT